MDLIVPYNIIREGHDQPLIQKVLTMIEPGTRWFEIVKYNNKQSAKISNIVKNMVIEIALPYSINVQPVK